jgi:FkbM family methyltransferase
MNDALRRAIDDIRASWESMPKTQALRWYLTLLLNLPSIARTRKFYTADLSMTGRRAFRLYGQDFEFNISEFNAAGGNGYTFCRELFVRKMYFRAFDKLRFSTCLDLGCNLGIVSYVMKRLGGSGSRVIAIDAQDFTGDSFRRRVSKLPGLEFSRGVVCSNRTLSDPDRLEAACAPFGFDKRLATSIDDILTSRNVSHVDLMKMDLEGAELDIFSEDAAWLAKVDNLAMETHPGEGSPKPVAERLQSNGFAVNWCSPFGYPSSIDTAGFLYASKVGALRRPLLQPR